MAKSIFNEKLNDYSIPLENEKEEAFVIAYYEQGVYEKVWKEKERKVKALISSHPDLDSNPVAAPFKGSQITIPTSDMTVVVGSGGGGGVVGVAP